jgi:cellobiose transport system substrate-binding protein
MVKNALRRRVGVAVGVVAALLLGSGCSSAGNGESTMTLTISDWGNFGFKSLLQTYHKLHPGIRVVEHVEDWSAHHDGLSKQLDTGKGATDVVGIDESYVAQFRDRPDGLYNLLDFGAGSLKGRWLGWKWQQSLSADGKVQIGLGTDVGGLGVCYRRDLFAQAGLPVDRDEVAKLWPTWEAYIATGRTFEAAKTSAHWIDSSTRMYSAVLAQQDTRYYDWGGNVVVATNPGVRRSFDLALQLIAAGESTKMKPSSTPWTAAMQAGKFATMMCPAWMLGQLQQNAPDARGKWDVATVPGGGGNWSGSFLAVPKQTKHPKEAYQLAAWLTAPEQQLTIFKETGNLPSQPALYADPAVRNLRNEFMNNAPVGQIFAASAANLRPQYLGPKTAAIGTVIQNTLIKVENGDIPDKQAWATALNEVGAAMSN